MRASGAPPSTAVLIGRETLMGAPTKMSAREAFDLNMQDAEVLVELARLLSNHRKRRMRRELRERLGSALSLAKRH